MTISIFSLIQDQIDLLKKFQHTSVEFILNACPSDDDRLNEFENRRGQILEEIVAIENKIKEELPHLRSIHKTREFHQKIDQLNRVIQELIAEVQVLDHQIFDQLNQEKNQLKELMNHFSRSEKLVRKFKSTWMNHSGERLDGSL